MPQGALLFQPIGYPHETWTSHLRRLMPELEIRTEENPARTDDIAYCIAWKPKPGSLAALKNLKVVFSMGAGVDGIVADPTYPKNLPLSRVVDHTLSQSMTEYVVLNVLYWHRRTNDLRALQQMSKWRQFAIPRAPSVRVGIFGFGVLGQAAAQALKALNYQLLGWSATPKKFDGVTTFHGQAQRSEFLRQSDILVCLLPLTPDTKGILNAQTFASLPRGACVINCARGGHLVESDLIQALDSEQLRGASLDVFQTEPLPETSPLWQHPKILISPHNAAMTDPGSFMEHVAATIRRMDKGLPPENLVDFARGY
ncbi:MAG: glyoxylate/hydroxypyruvate reductase A [Micropepsaceae bacterium]